MTLDEAITHAREIAGRGGECAEDHEQLAEWLEELRKLRAIAASLGGGTCKLELATDMESIRCNVCGYKLPKGTDLKATKFCGGCGCEVEQ